MLFEVKKPSAELITLKEKIEGFAELFIEEHVPGIEQQDIAICFLMLAAQSAMTIDADPSTRVSLMVQNTLGLMKQIYEEEGIDLEFGIVEKGGVQ